VDLLDDTPKEIEKMFDANKKFGLQVNSEKTMYVYAAISSAE
jgi:hypothetical protein